ncbi:NAD(P)-binding protein [Thozetella sp. PMI_491]|nr:NAD(P)-binding protein [Thozetella sp. PMI_491]
MAPLVWLITGCSSGFGEQFVSSALARGDKVIATGRNAAKRLKHLESAGAAIVELDIGLPEVEIKHIVDNAVQIYGTIDVLVNNAGIGCNSYRKIFEVNYFGAQSVTRAVIPYMRAKKSGTIAFMGSMFGWWVPGGVTAYGGTKFALEAFVHGLQGELAPFNIRTTIFSPGCFRTGFTNAPHMVLTNPEDMLEAYGPLNQKMKDAAQNLFGNERGDTKKGVELMIDVIRGEGCAAQRKFPTHLPVGMDAVVSIETKCKETLKLIELWRKDISSTDRDDFEEISGIESIVIPAPMEV